MKRDTINSIALIIVVSSICFVLGMWNKPDVSSLNSETAAVEFFRAHREQFEDLRRLLEVNPFIVMNVEGDNLLPADAFTDRPTAKEKILRFMRDLNLKFVNGTESDWGIRCVYSAEGMAVGSSTLGFHYNTKSPGKVVSIIEGTAPTSESDSVFRKIDENWYLQFEWGGDLQAAGEEWRCQLFDRRRRQCHRTRVLHA